MSYVLAVIVGLIALAIGSVFPDVDQALRSTPLNGLLGHRSIFTHGFLLSLFLLQAAKRYPTPAFRFATIGFSVGVATHLVFDLFPRAWFGFANIYVPMVRHLPPILSMLWILLSIILCLSIAFVIAKKQQPVLMLTIASIPLAFFLTAAVEPSALFTWPFVVLALLAGVAWYLIIVPPNQKITDMGNLSSKLGSEM